jgi:hypothetical protein
MVLLWLTRQGGKLICLRPHTNWEVTVEAANLVVQTRGLAMAHPTGHKLPFTVS